MKNEKRLFSEKIRALTHQYGAIFAVDTTSIFAMRPIHIEEENIDFCMTSAQKGLYTSGKVVVIEAVFFRTPLREVTA